MSAVIFNGDSVKALKDKLKMKSGALYITGDTDNPTVVAKDAPTGSLYVRSGTNELYQKKDNGSSTNWTLKTDDTNFASQFTTEQYKTGLSAGVGYPLPTYTNNGDGTLDISAGTVNIYDNANNTGRATKTNISAKAGLTFTDMALSYIVCKDIGAGFQWYVITDVNEINESNVIPVYTIVRTGTTLHILNWDALGDGLANKLNMRLVKTERFARESGITLSEAATRTILVAAGTAWNGGARNTILAASSATDYCKLFYHVAGVWTSTDITQYDNTRYDDGTSLQTLSNNRYAVNFVYRGIEDAKHIYVVLGTGDYTLSLAQTAQPPASLPFQISSHAILTGKIIVLKGASTATLIQSAYTVPFNLSTAISHGDLTNLGVDDHPQYLLTTGTRDVTGIIGYDTDKTFTDSKDIIAKKYVDDGLALKLDNDNYILNGDAKENTSGWVTYADAASTTPTDGIGGSPSVTFVRNTSSPMFGTADFLFTKDAADRQGQGVSYDFTVDAGTVNNNAFSISFFAKSSTNYVSNDLRIYIYDVTNSSLITPSFFGMRKNSYGSLFNATFIPSSTSTSYRLIFHICTTNANAYTINFSKIRISVLKSQHAYYQDVSGQTTTSGNVITWDSKVVDTHNALSSGAFTCKMNGILTVVGKFTGSAVVASDGGYFGVYLVQNSSNVEQTTNTYSPATTSQAKPFQFHFNYNVSFGDVIELKYLSTLSTTLSTTATANFVYFKVEPIC